ncbi:hypothetical protein PILCRDRAFT_826760 [Piloderma croceum F 1598]|uniref:Uncharacterized protein n=1 Tax=Piloderma croceum (strain F 1598) TaxID=765440 RepID=A0A0C3F7S1_PILCF|nr:hypothetical protein PILCRDRAFT_826760 [Piloderma croceum F 1598]
MTITWLQERAPIWLNKSDVLWTKNSESSMRSMTAFRIYIFPEVQELSGRTRVLSAA